ncbi:hypothetical protein HNQ91_001093 [Filimonas zeae]|nr:hypothetical protein [Filimonas zeae]MDR6338071.1 hypothetical protein [Filimonas zeae]
MKKSTALLTVLLAITAVLFAQQRDSAATARDTSKPAPTAIQPPPSMPASNRTNDSVAASPNGDSLGIVKSVDTQRGMGAALYKNKAKHFLPSALISLLLVVGLGLYLLFNTALCRDQSVDPLTNQLRPAKERPYSYSRMQLFWWTMIIFWCICSFYFYTGVLLALTPTAVLLLGGGLAVSVFGNVIDNAQRAQNNTTVPIRHQDLCPAGNMLTDILSDEAGISIHRLQAVFANLIFGMAFLTHFIRALDVTYPLMDFENWQMTLLGVSAAGYLGFKANENSSATVTERQVEAVRNAQNTLTQVQVANAINPQAAASAPASTPALQQLQAQLQAKGII